MQGKALIKFFTYMMVLVVAYQFMLWIPINNVESKADSYAMKYAGSEQDEGIKKLRMDSLRQFFLDSVSGAKVFSIPGVREFTYQELKEKQLAFGLDLQGGMMVTLQVDLHGLFKDLAKNSEDAKFVEAMNAAKEAQTNSQSDFVTLFEENYKGDNLALIFSRSGKLPNITLESSNADVITALREISAVAVQSTEKMLKERIDRFGVAQPNISLDKATNRITVELPGVSNPKRARRYIQATAKLEFCEMYTGNEVIQGLVALNNILKTKEDLAKQSDTTNVAQDTLGMDSLAMQNEAAGPLFRLLIPLQSNDARIGEASVKDLAKIDLLLSSPEAKKALPRGVRLVWAAKTQENQQPGRLFLYAINTRMKKKAPLGGEVITRAQAVPNPNGPGYAVSLDMNNRGAQKWKELTGKMAADPAQRQIGIILDSRVESAPTVDVEISGGSTLISGSMDEVSEAEDLANILSVGQLPTETIIIEEAVIGPSLGQETVNAGLMSLAAGFVIVLLFMLGYYASAGLISIIALFLNVFFIIGSLSSFGTVLTLPGIAGIVLTIGMAVDANVIIFERIREELRGGVDWKEAISKGFSYSYSAIIDANITTLLTALVLFQYGLGPIKGFATVLIIGVICSVFCAVLVGRMLFANKVDADKEIKVSSSFSQNFLANPGINFVAKRKMAYMISGVILALGIASIAVRGFELGVDLQGGRTYTIEFNKSVDTEAFKTAVVKSFADSKSDDENSDKVILKRFDKDNQVKLTTSFLQKEEKSDEKVLALIHEAAKTYSGNATTLAQFAAGKPKEATGENFYLNASSKVGPTIADDIQGSALKSALIALSLIFLYILFRFNRWQYSAGALAALVHDVLFVLSIFSIFHGILPWSLEIDQAFIAAILTVIGYSINDTVVVFDRIREVGQAKKEEESFASIVNVAVNNTLSRTFITSLTTLLVVLILFLFGGDGIRGFAFALLVGVLVGTYSSVFIATPVLVDTTGGADIFDAEEEEDERKDYGNELVDETVEEA